MLTHFTQTYKDSLNVLYPSQDDFCQDTVLQSMIQKYIHDEMEAYIHRQKNFDTEKYIKRQIKTLLARSLYDPNKATKIWLEDDNTYQKAIEVINNTSMFKKMKIHY
jgi:hypothetical protein